MYLGNEPALAYTSFAKQDFTTSATTSYTLDNPVANENEIALFINFVRQEPTTAYTASGTSLTLTSATSASDDMYCVFIGKAVQTVNPPSGSVNTAQLVDDAVTFAKTDGNFGKVGQVVQTTLSGLDSTTSSSFVDTGLSGSITPSSTSSKILILISAQLGNTSSSANNQARILRGTTEIITFSRVSFNSAGHADCQNSYIYLDSPSTTSATTFKLQYATDTGTFRINDQSGGTSNSTITLMEILG